MELLVAVVVGVGIGVLSGLLGIGGGTVMVPVFKLGFGMSAIGATGTSLFAIIPTSVSGGITHIRQKTCIPKLGVLAGIGGACLSPVGVWLASMSPGWLIMLAAAIVIGYSAITMFVKALRAPKGSGGAADGGDGNTRGDAPEGAVPSEARRSAAQASPSCAPLPHTLDEGTDGVQTATDGTSPSGASLGGGSADEGASGPRGGKGTGKDRYWLGLPIGGLAGIVAGYVGVGGGFLMVPLFLSVLHLDMKRASGSSLLAIGILSTPGAIMQIALGNVAVLVAVAVVAGSVPGAVLGAKLAKRVPERQLRFAFGAILLVAAVLLVLQEVGLF